MNGLYLKLALDGMRKNKRLYLPYALTSVCMVMMYYIMVALMKSETVKVMRGGDAVATTLGFGTWTIAIFSCIFLFYTNSFLIKRRKKELGLYNVLGMNKLNICRLLLAETLIIFIASLVLGILCGILFSKLAELLLIKILQDNVNFVFSVSGSGIIMSSLVFLCIFALLYINSVVQIGKNNAVNLLKSENMGEKPPKANWFAGVLGVIFLAFGYVLALKTQDPVEAMAMFFTAVICVIIGTYLLMIFGSVLMCRIMQANTRYYYKKNHFVSVSSMKYRMRRNGAGLASICILATMVLVMISFTASLYFGMDEVIEENYPKDAHLRVDFMEAKLCRADNTKDLFDKIEEAAEKNNVNIKAPWKIRLFYGNCYNEGNTMSFDTELNNYSGKSDGKRCYLWVIGIDDYNNITGGNEVLASNEALLYMQNSKYEENSVYFTGGSGYKIKKRLEDFPNIGINTPAFTEAVMNLVVSDFDSALKEFSDIQYTEGGSVISAQASFYFDSDVEASRFNTFESELLQDIGEEEEVKSFSSFLRSERRKELLSVYGGLFFLGIILSVVFVIAAVQIIYYKQVSEGYEDSARFGIMQKVGMNKKEIRKSVNSQLLTVFFLPLLFAAMHLVFAFPMVQKILLLCELKNVRLFAVTTLICFGIYSLFYAVVYKKTSSIYYNIITKTENQINV